MKITLFSFNEKSATLLVFFVHALIFSVLYIKKGLDNDDKESYWLAAFIFLGALYICPFMFGYAGWYSANPYREFMFFFPFQQLFLIGPVFYFYVIKLLKIDQNSTGYNFLHFLPGVAYGLYSIIVFVADKLILDDLYFYADGKDKDLSSWYQIAGFISMIIYLVLSLRKYFDYRIISQQTLSYADEVDYKWLKRFIQAFALILLLRFIFFFTNPEWWNFGSKYWYYLCFSVLLMYISLTGYARSLKVYIPSKFDILSSPQDKDRDSNINSVSGIEDNLDLHHWKVEIGRLFDEEKCYENPFLTLDDVAAKLMTNRNVISKTINQEFGKNFNDYVNQKRVFSMIAKLENREHERRNLFSLGLDSGFNSKPTFNRAFKKFTGLTPNQYIAKHKL